MTDKTLLAWQIKYNCTYSYDSLQLFCHLNWLHHHYCLKLNCICSHVNCTKFYIS